MDQLDRILRTASAVPDAVLPLESAGVPREFSRISEILRGRPAAVRSGGQRWRVVFVISERMVKDSKPHVALGPIGPPASITVVSQYRRKDGVLGRMEKYHQDYPHEPADAATEALVARLSVDGGEAPLLAHWDHIVANPGLPLYLAGPDGRGRVEYPLAPRRIAHIGISFQPVAPEPYGDRDIRVRPVIRVDLEGDSAGPREIAWADAWMGRIVVLAGSRWLGWCDGDERLIALVGSLASGWLLDRREVSEIKQKVDAEKSALVTAELPFRRIRLVTRRPQADLTLQEDSRGTTARLSFRYPEEPSPAGNGTAAGSGAAAPAPPSEEYVLAQPDREFEANVEAVLKELFPWPGYEWRATMPLTEFLAAHGEELLSRGIGLCIGDPSNRLSRTSQRVNVRVSSGIDWFDLSASAGEDLDLSKVDPRDPLFAHGFVRNAGKIISIGVEEAEKLRSVLALLDPSQRSARVSRLDLGGAALLHQLAPDEAPLELQRAAEISRALAKPAELGRADPPRAFHGELRDYQRIGFGWLSFLAANNLNGCLADDMGLGKTVQALAFLLALKEKKESRGASLVVAPVSTLQNWKAEAARFTPGLRTVVHHGNDRHRAAAAFKAVDLVIVSYATLRVDQELFQEHEWATLILDEAQSIKNPASQSFGVVKKLRSAHRFTLTGTPLENSVIDLWAQVDFLEPGLLGSLQRFKRQFGVRPGPGATGSPPDPERERLRRLVAPFILRRTKEVVEKSLPPKEEIQLFAEMGPRQKAAYDALRESFRRRISLALKTKGVAGSGALIFEGLLRLRQAACFPAQASPSLKGVPSAKLELLAGTLTEIIAEGHRVLVFSQFVQSLQSIAAAMDGSQVRYSYLDGSTRNRQDIIDEFQSDPGIPLFLLSLKAGGLGINLTAADYVVLFDPWWNPAVERQAVDRSHRIGQAKHVFVYRLITRDSIEERILALQEQKRALAAELIEENPRSLLSLGEKELIGLFD